MSNHEERETFLYKLEAVLSGDRLLTVVVVADTDEKAFRFAENHILRQTVEPPTIVNLSLVQKKPLGRGGVGYVVETAHFTDY